MQMKKKGRYNIRLARRHQVSVIEDNSPQGLADFVRLYEQTVFRKGIRRHSPNYFRSMHEIMQRVKARKDEIVRQSNEGVTNWLKNMENLSVYEGHARFESPTTVRVGDKLLEAEKCFISCK